MKPKVRFVPITQLVLDEKNANKGTKRGRKLLEESLEKYGAGRSVLVDRRDRVIAGNKTVEAARAAGMKSIAVIETDGSSLVAVQRGDLDLKRDRKARELAIADNRVGELDLEWNPEVLASLDVDLTQFWNENELRTLLKDFRGNELSAPEPKIDQAAELQRKWKIDRGQIWEIGQHRLMCGDSASASDVTALMDGKTAKLCATDPPYLVSYDARNHPSENFSDGKNKDWKGRYADKPKHEPVPRHNANGRCQNRRPSRRGALEARNHRGNGPSPRGRAAIGFSLAQKHVFVGNESRGFQLRHVNHLRAELKMGLLGSRRTTARTACT